MKRIFRKDECKKNGGKRVNKDAYKQAVANTINESNMSLVLIRKGIDVGYINCPVPNDYQTKQDIIDKYTNYEIQYEIDKDNPGKYKEVYLLWVDDCGVIFDDFKEEWF